MIPRCIQTDQASLWRVNPETFPTNSTCKKGFPANPTHHCKVRFARHASYNHQASCSQFFCSVVSSLDIFVFIIHDSTSFAIEKFEIPARNLSKVLTGNFGNVLIVLTSFGHPDLLTLILGTALIRAHCCRDTFLCVKCKENTHAFGVPMCMGHSLRV